MGGDGGGDPAVEARVAEATVAATAAVATVAAKTGG